MASHYTKFIKENSRKEDGRKAITNAALQYRQLPGELKNELKKSFVPPNVPPAEKDFQEKWSVIQRLSKQLEKRCLDLGILYYIACVSTENDANLSLVRGSAKAKLHLSEPFRELLEFEENRKKSTKPDKNKLKQEFRSILKKKLGCCSNGKYTKLPQKLMKTGTVQFLVHLSPDASPSPLKEASFPLWSDLGAVGIKTLQYLIINPESWDLEMVKDLGGSAVVAEVGADSVAADAEAMEDSTTLSPSGDVDAQPPNFCFAPDTEVPDCADTEVIMFSDDVGTAEVHEPQLPIASSSFSKRSVQPSEIVFVTKVASGAESRLPNRNTVYHLPSAPPTIVKQRRKSSLIHRPTYSLLKKGAPKDRD